MNRLTKITLLILGISLLVTNCGPQKETTKIPEKEAGLPGTWPFAVTYEIFVQSFYDSNGDGIGDIPGMTSKLDYLQELGIQAVWLMPIMPSPSYHKYDVTDYKGIHPDYGTEEDFRRFTDEAHKRGIRVVIDFIINHTDKSHPWFMESKKGRNITNQQGEEVPNPYWDYYEWKTLKAIKKEGTMTKESEGDSDNIVKWYEVEGMEQLYYGYFGSHMPDINFDNEVVKQEVFEIGKWWLSEMGIDGFRLDAAKHIFDHYPEKNHSFWIEFREAMQTVKQDVYLVGEVWADAETVAPYLQGLPASFNFDMGYAIVNAVNNGSDTSLVKRYKEITEYYQSVTEDFIDATFIRNHDQNRVLNDVGGDLRKAKMAASLLLTLPGSPYLYYGEEIGMAGQKPDEHIREPFLWDMKENDSGRPTWIEAKYSTDEMVVSLSQQMEDQKSLYNHYKTLIKLRNNHKALTFGDINITDLSDDRLISFTRESEGHTALVIHNISPESVTIDLSGTRQRELLFSTDPDFSTVVSPATLPGFSTVILN
ncbi:MAG: alpha-amylase family glycosyl hydrolase [Bacteroidetes bacterium]|nr:alpha-amylase family glycosyl hydrolase [Bacteroidota bacterium]